MHDFPKALDASKPLWRRGMHAAGEPAPTIAAANAAELHI